MTAEATAATVRAPAKLTRTLRVTGVRDDGYHLIDAEMVVLELADDLTITPSAETSITVSGPFSVGVPSDRSNLIAKALDVAGLTASVHVHKRIPNGGGLGGGSADAAAVLRWAGVGDPTVAVRVGADVPFCMSGGRARVRGIGEVIEALPPLAAPIVVTLVVPPFGVSTPAVYNAWDRLGAPRADGPNDLEPAALAVEPRLVAWRDRIIELAGCRPVLAGSGATWFVEGRRDNALAPLRNEGATVLVTSTA